MIIRTVEMDLKCYKCKRTKARSEFSKNSCTASGFSYRCKECDKQYKKLYKLHHNDKIIEGNKNYREANKQRISDYKKDWYLKNTKHHSDRMKKNYSENKEVYLARVKKYREENREEVKRRKLEYLNTPKGRAVRIAQRRKEYSVKYNSDPVYTLNVKIRARIRMAIKKGAKTGSAVRDLGCSIQDFRKYIESKFQDGMSWDNWGVKGWHLDHIIPVSHFDLSDREQFKQAVHYTNLQPLWAKDNLLKSDKIL